MRHRKQIILLAVIALLAASPAQAQTLLRYQHKEKDKLHYVFEQEITTTMNVKGKESDTKLNVIWDLSWNVLKVEADGAAQLQIKITRARMFVDGPAGKATADSDDKNEPDDALRLGMARAVKSTAVMDLRGVILPTGEITAVKPAEETLKALKELGGAPKEADLLNSDVAKSMLLSTVLLSDAVAKGKTWTTKTEAKAPFGKTIMENIYAYEGPTEKDGVKLEKISIKPAMKIEPDAKATIKVEIKDFKGTGQVLFDNKAGRLIETFIHQRTEMRVEAMGMNFGQTIEQRMVIRLKGK
jgi:hypothetical protein